MKNIKRNPCLTYDAVRAYLIKGERAELIVGASLHKDAHKIVSHALVESSHSDLTDGNGFATRYSSALVGQQWILITSENVYYSKGDASN